MSLSFWNSPTGANYPNWEKDSKITSLGIDKHKKELEEITDTIKKLKDYIEVLRRFDFKNPGYVGIGWMLTKVAGKVVLSLNKLSTFADMTIEVKDEVMKQVQISSMEEKIRNLYSRQQRLLSSLSTAAQYRDEINAAFSGANQKERLIETLEGQLRSYEREFDSKNREKDELEHHMYRYKDWFAINCVNSELGSIINKLNDLRRDIDIAADDIGRYKNIRRYMHW